MKRFLATCLCLSLLGAGVDAKPQTIPLLKSKKVVSTGHVPGDFKRGFSKSKNGEWRINGTVTGVNLPAWQMTMTDGTTGYSIIVQRTTEFLTPRGQIPGMIALNPGDDVTVVGLGMDDGRILATKINLRRDVAPSWEPAGTPVGATPGLFVSNLHSGMVVPPIFNVMGRAKPRSWVRVTVHSTHPLTPEVVNTQVVVFNVDGRADGLGKFSLPVRADNEPPGSRILLEVITGDAFGNRSGPVMVNVLRQ